MNKFVISWEDVGRFFHWSFWSLVVSAAATFADKHYVDIKSPYPKPPYSTWETAATNIQDAVDEAEDGDMVFVNDGVYATGGRVTPGYSLTNRVVITKNIYVYSVNGPRATIIVGQRPVGPA
ncbi:MAG: hypothetical protein N2255_07085, partial [Kiritimatiellae bacterium]|nr:hypothetical protein [Kiritimatiellia bacterium]